MKLYKSDSNKMIAGVCGGVGEFFGIDATIIRIIWAFLALIFGSDILLYIICAILIPKKQ
ncbi:PspC domain-containing protein [Clostridium tyrobutyricum]|uniref:PspC domain-containing protein n=1 Tax=Clostridium tyrobutyricum TaxID=1519 RepID=UPI00057D4521